MKPAVIMLLTIILWITPYKGTVHADTISYNPSSHIAHSAGIPSRMLGGTSGNEGKTVGISLQSLDSGSHSPDLSSSEGRHYLAAGRSGPLTPKTSGDEEGRGLVRGLIRFYAQQYGIEEDLPTRIAIAESGLQASVENKSSGACGVFQYLPSTWRNTPSGKAGKSCKDPEANVQEAVRYIATKGTGPWNSSKSVWNK